MSFPPLSRMWERLEVEVGEMQTAPLSHPSGEWLEDWFQELGGIGRLETRVVGNPVDGGQ